jgi:hypothetical protein
VDVGVLDGNTSRSEQGWACEQGHAKVKLCSPWEWPGFNAISLDKTTPSEWAERLLTHHYKPDNELLKKLYEVMDLNEDGDLSPDELKQAWKESWFSQTLSRLIILHDSEWGLAMLEWDKLDPLLLENEGVKKLFPNWVEEKKRIKKLRWWVIENFAGLSQSNKITLELIVKVTGMNGAWFTGEGGGSVFANIFRQNYPDVYNFDKNSFILLLNEAMERCGIIASYHQAHFLVQIFHESARFDTTLEYESGAGYELVPSCNNT